MGFEPIKNQGLSLSAVPVCIIQEVISLFLSQL